MGKMGEAANLGAVAIAAFIVYKLAGFKFELPKFEFPQIGLMQTLHIEDLREKSRKYREELEEHSTNLENIIARDPFPIIPPLDIKKPAYFEETLEYHRERLATYKAIDVQPYLEQTAALETSLTELQAILPRPSADVDAGGSTDMDSSLTDVYWRTGRPIPI